MRYAEKVGLTTTEPGTTFEEMLNAIRDSLSDLASSDPGEDAEEEEYDKEDLAGGKLSAEDEPSWVMGTISEMILHRMEHYRQQQMKLDQFTQPGWEDVADNFCDSDSMYGMTELKVPAVVQPQIADDVAPSVPMTFSEPLETLDNVPRRLQMPQVTSRPGSSHMKLGLRKLQTCEHIASLLPAAMPD